MHQNYGFCEYVSEDDADYATKILNQVKLFGKPLRINKATSDKKNLDVGASLFIGNLSPEADETLLRDTFSAFGTIVGHAKIARDLETGQSKGYGFVSFDNFDSSDAAIDAMNGQILANKPITVGYAYKKDGKGERHGSAAGTFCSESHEHAYFSRHLIILFRLVIMRNMAVLTQLFMFWIIRASYCGSGTQEPARYAQ